MAFSSSEGKLFFSDWLTHFAKPLGFKRFLDIGCGAGGYGILIREVFDGTVKIHAVEPFKEYIWRHKLTETYDEVICRDIRDILHEIEQYDLIIAGDVLEHLAKEQAIDVVSGVLPKCRFFWGALPISVGKPWSIGYRQGPEDYEENPLNKHLHDWTGEEIREEFNPMWIVPYIQTGSFLIEGGIR